MHEICDDDFWINTFVKRTLQRVIQNRTTLTSTKHSCYCRVIEEMSNVPYQRHCLASAFHEAPCLHGGTTISRHLEGRREVFRERPQNLSLRFRRSSARTSTPVSKK